MYKTRRSGNPRLVCQELWQCFTMLNCSFRKVTVHISRFKHAAQCGDVTTILPLCIEVLFISLYKFSNKWRLSGLALMKLTVLTCITDQKSCLCNRSCINFSPLACRPLAACCRPQRSTNHKLKTPVLGDYRIWYCKTLVHIFAVLCTCSKTSAFSSISWWLVLVNGAHCRKIVSTMLPTGISMHWRSCQLLDMKTPVTLLALTCTQSFKSTWCWTYLDVNAN